MAGIKRIQDSVHGLMEFRGMESLVVEVLRTPELQRLRKIRQLGLAHLVFPGAEHSRLVHSLGAAFLAVRFGRHLQDVTRSHFIPALCPDETTTRDFAMAALCHDLGHGPLSHAWEREIIGSQFDRRKWADAFGLGAGEQIEHLKWHEIVGHGLLNWPEGQLHRLLEQHEEGTAQQIRRLLQGKYFIPYIPRLLSSDIDVDRADFIRRDTHQTGVAYGRYDLNWLISTCTVGRTKGDGFDEWVVGFDERKSIRVIEQFLIARRAMYETVYHHKTVRCAEGMMGLFLRRLRKVVVDGVKLEVARFVQPIVRVMNGAALQPHEVSVLDDFAISVLVDSVADDQFQDVTARDLAQRIRSRDLFKQVPLSSDKINRFLRTEGAHSALRDVMKPFCRGESEYYLVIDEPQFKMLSHSDASKTCLVDSNGVATYANDHPAFESHRRADTEAIRLFAPREALLAIQACIDRPGI